MSGKIKRSIYPCVEQVKNLPLYLTGIGGTEYQEHIKRTEGYWWDQILYCAEGSGRLKYDNVSVDITEGSFFFLPACYPHEYFSNSSKWSIHWVVFAGFDCKRILSELNMTKPAVMRFNDHSVLRKLFDKMLATLKTDIVYGNFTCSSLIYQYIIEFHRLASDRNTIGGSGISNVLVPALNYIEENFREDFSVSVLAEISGISQQYLCRIFKQAMNMRPNEYITRRRLKESKQLLIETDIPICKICLQSGFSDSGYFSTVFKRYEGITPAKYRRRNSGIVREKYKQLRSLNDFDK